MSSEDQRDNRQREPGRLVRPYYMTGGRGGPRASHTDLEIEALVSTTALGAQAPQLTVEQRAIAALCRDILSIARCQPDGPAWGVARVVIGDMAAEGCHLHRPTTVGDRPDLALSKGCLWPQQI